MKKSFYKIIPVILLLSTIVSIYSCAEDSKAKELDNLKAENASLSTQLTDVQSSIQKLMALAKTKIDSANAVIISKNNLLAVKDATITEQAAQIANNNMNVEVMLNSINSAVIQKFDSLKSLTIKK